MDEFYRSILDLQPEPALNDARIKAQGYSAHVAFETDGQTQFHLATKDLGLGFHMKHAVNPVERGHIAFRPDDIESFKKRLDEKGIPYSDYGKWSMNGWYHGNVIEVHQVDD